MSGCEWIVEAHGCHPEALSDPARLRALFARLIGDMELHPVGDAVWRQFPGSGGITGLSLLEESHIAVHTFPEYGSLCLNVFCCRPRPEWNFDTYLQAEFGSTTVCVRRIERPYGEDAARA